MPYPKNLRVLFAILIALLLSGCSGDDSNSKLEDSNDTTQLQTQKVKENELTQEQKDDLKKMAQSLSVTYDDFEESYLVDSGPDGKCPGHSIWIQFTVSGDNTNLVPSIFLFSQDDINDKIGQPLGVRIKHKGETFDYSDWRGGNLDNIPCDNGQWGYPREHYLDKSNEFLEYMAEVFLDPTSKFRLLPDEIQSGYRDVNMTNNQRNRNLSAIKVLTALRNSQITPRELFQN